MQPMKSTMTALNAPGSEAPRRKTAEAQPFSVSSAAGRVRRGGVVAFFVYSVGYAVTYLSQLVVARLIGAQDYGIYAYVTAWATVLIYVSTLGFDVALLRFVPVYRAKDAWGLMRGVVRYARRSVAIVGSVLALASAGLFLAWQPDDALAVPFIIGFATVPVVALLRVQCTVLRASGAVVAALAPDRIVREGSLVVLVSIATLVLGWQVSAQWALTAALVGAVTGLLLAYYAQRVHHPLPGGSLPPSYDTPAWRKAALPLMIAGATEVLINRMGVIVLGWTDHTQEAGIYSLAFNVALLVTLPRVAVNTLFAPAISSLHAAGDRQALQALVRRTAQWTLVAAAAIAAVIFVLADPLMSSFGAAYREGVAPLRVLLVAQVLAVGAGSQLYVMTMTGHERSAAVLLVAAASANVVVSLMLVQFFGVVGAAIGSAGTLLAWNAMMALWIWRRLGLMPGLLCLRTSQA